MAMQQELYTELPQGKDEHGENLLNNFLNTKIKSCKSQEESTGSGNFIKGVRVEKFPTTPTVTSDNVIAKIDAIKVNQEAKPHVRVSQVVVIVPQHDSILT